MKRMVNFIRTDPLLKNELNQFIAWVDYTGTKSAAQHATGASLRPSKSKNHLQPAKKK